MSRQGSLIGSLLGSSLLLAACGPTKVPGPEDAPEAAPELLSVRLVNKINIRLAAAKPMAEATAAFIAAASVVWG